MEVDQRFSEAMEESKAGGPREEKEDGARRDPEAITLGGAVKRLGFLDRYLSAWIILAAGTGLGLGQASAVIKAIGATSIGTTNVLVAIGLVCMIYPPLAKVRWGAMGEVLRDRQLLALTLVLNWVVGPLLMFCLSVAFFHQSFPSFMSGLSLVGCARCIAMVLVWNDLAGGDAEYCAAIVALNSLMTIALYPPYSLALLVTLPQLMFGSSTAPSTVNVTTADIAQSVGIYLGVPLGAAVLTWALLTRAKGREWYYGAFTPRIGKITLFSLLFTVVVLFASQSRDIINKAGAVAYAAVPLALYFFSMFIGSFKAAQMLGATYMQAVTLAFTAASNNFELSLAVSVGTFGLQSDEALMSVVGALIEIPTMLSLVYLAFYFRDHWTFRQAKQVPLPAPSKPGQQVELAEP